MTAVFVVMAGASFLLLLFGKEADRLSAAVGVIMFGGGGLAWFVGEFLTKPADPPRDGIVRFPDGTNSPALILPLRAGRARTGIVAVVAFGIGSLIITLNPTALGPRMVGTQWLFAGITLILGITVLNAVRGWKGGEPMVALAPTGICARGLDGTVFVPWPAIRRVKRTDFRGQPLLGIDVSAAGSIKRTGGPRLLAFLERPMMRHDQTFNLSGLAMSPDEAAQLVEHYHGHPEARSRLGNGSADDLLRAARHPNGRGS